MDVGLVEDAHGEHVFARRQLNAAPTFSVRKPVRWPNVSSDFTAARANAHEKDAVEGFLNRAVCRGATQLAEAQHQIAAHWLAVYRQNGLKPVMAEPALNERQRAYLLAVFETDQE